ncbi:c-type cytochrome [Legionella genomosp. 1]|uniref:c-type cytochrome n=1 Tax=Legionella genomosp. 1 TaxID=1093625 RepID=UPI0010546787|nr:c-type cytochrome [Legionella genomosp. 1]
MKKFSSLMILILVALQVFPGKVCFSFPLEIKGQKQTAVLNKAELQTLKLETLEMDYSRAYPNRKMKYQTVRLCDLLDKYQISPDNILEFVANDQFSVLIPARLILNCQKNASIAYLAIEPDKKWPVLFNHTNTTAGPYAVIWTDPELSYISDEYWAWSVVQIIEHQRINESIVISAPARIPQKIKTRVLNGYNIYVSHCSSCHTLKHIGKATIGPDLIYPKTIFEYYPDINQLKQFIRNPDSVRKLPNSRMSGSSYVGLKDDDLDDLIDYFKFIAKGNNPGV